MVGARAGAIAGDRRRVRFAAEPVRASDVLDSTRAPRPHRPAAPQSDSPPPPSPTPRLATPLAQAPMRVILVSRVVLHIFKVPASHVQVSAGFMSGATHFCASLSSMFSRTCSDAGEERRGRRRAGSVSGSPSAPSPDPQHTHTMPGIRPHPRGRRSDASCQMRRRPSALTHARHPHPLYLGWVHYSTASPLLHGATRTHTDCTHSIPPSCTNARLRIEVPSGTVPPATCSRP